MIKNSKGKIFYGMHFYPGVAEYAEPGKDPYRVFLNEDTIRAMDPTFAGRPIFVEHVDEVSDKLDDLKKEADGWVVESFFNAADGKHWAKFIVVSERAERAIKLGMRLSNAYVPTHFSNGGLWNGVSYAKEVTGGEYEHLAIVKNPRYEESIILDPEQFKKYNEDKILELKRLSNSKDEKEKSKMAFKFFKRTAVENSTDLSGMIVVLPKSGKEVEVSTIINSMDEMEMGKGKEQMASPDHMVALHDGTKMNVADLVMKHKAMHDELAALKAPKKDEMESESGLEVEAAPVEVEGDKKANEESEEEKAKKAKDKKENEEKEIEAEKKKNALDSEKAAKAKEAKEKAERLRNAHLNGKDEEVAKVEFSADQVERGKKRYGSN